MGWLEGVLTGYANRHYEIEKEKMREAELAADREGRVFETLLSSPYKDIQDYASAGILDLSNPRRRKGGVAGWMGEVEKTPYLDMIRRTREQFAADPEYAAGNLRSNYYPWLGLGSGEQGGAPPPTPSVPTVAGSAPGAPSAALPSTSLVTGGPMTPPTPAPTAPGAASTPPPAPPAPAVGAGQSPGAVGQLGAAVPTAVGQLGAAQSPMAVGQLGVQPDAAMAPPVPPAGPPLPVSVAPPPPPGQVAAGLPGATTRPVGRPAPVPPSRTQLPGIFPTQADVQRDQARSAVAGKIDAYAEMYRAQGYDEPTAYAKAADLLERDLLNAGGLGQSYAEGNVIPDATSPTGFSQELYLRADPRRRMLIPAQPPNTPEYMAEKARQTALARGQANSTIPLSTQQRTQLTNSLHDDWLKLQGPLREMSRQFELMETGLKRFHEGEKVASVEAIRVTLEKILDPNSVVREGEYARQGFGLSLIDRMNGLWQRYAQGGGDIPEPILAEMVETARQFLAGMTGWNDNERQRITNLATNNSIDPAYVFGGSLATPPPAPPTANPNAAAAPAGPGVIDWNTPLVYDPVTRKMVPQPKAQ